MFERYTESARRALFFARYETTQFGGAAIETEHLLLGLLRERKGLVARILAHAQVPLESLRTEIEGRLTAGVKVATSVEVPFSAGTKRVLQFAAEQADGLRHNYIGTEHLLLGLLREESSVAASVLVGRGLRLDEVRNLVVQWLAEKKAGITFSNHAGAFDQIENLHQLVAQLAAMIADDADARALAARIHQSLDQLKRHRDRPGNDE